MSQSLTLDMSSSVKLELSVTQALCEIIDSPRALTVYLLIKYEEYAQLLDLGINPCDYQDHSNFADDYLATVMLSKSSQLPFKVDRKAKALEVFYASEQSCRRANDRISFRTFPPSVERARALLSKILRPLRRADLDFVESAFRFGPGATTGVLGSGCVLSDKYDEEIHLTRSLIPFYRSILGDRWWSLRTSPVLVEGNKFTTVPKNAKTDRGICVEPTLNIYGQLGVGALLRKRLLHLGVDLRSQERNQFLASKAQAWGLATVDLSAASDTLSWKCVMELLPSDWFELLDLFRSPYTKLDDNYIELEKFSSMGNGYTFELESLIFAAVALSCVPLHDHDKVSVYGDDIIVPQYAANEMIEALEYLGFSVNHKKSFLAGSFFESCGTDWFNGQNVRPFYLRQEVGSKIPYPVQIANQLRLYAKRRGGDLFCDKRFKPLWLALYNGSPQVWRSCRVPASFGDTGFIVSQDEHGCRHASKDKKFLGWQGWVVKHISCQPVRIRKETMGRLLAALARPSPEVSTNGFEPKRGFLGRAVPKLSVVSTWTEGLEWL